jgi:hypothetical protein
LYTRIPNAHRQDDRSNVIASAKVILDFGTDLFANQKIQLYSTLETEKTLKKPRTIGCDKAEDNV